MIHIVQPISSELRQQARPSAAALVAVAVAPVAVLLILWPFLQWPGEENAPLAASMPAVEEILPVEVEVAPVVEAEPEVEADADTEPDPLPEVVPDVAPKAEIEAEPTPPPTPEAEPELDPVVESEPKSQPSPVVKEAAGRSAPTPAPSASQGTVAWDDLPRVLLDVGGVRMTIAGQVRNRRLVNFPSPAYSPADRSAYMEGKVIIRFEVLPDGTVRPDAWFEQTTAFRNLNRAAIRAVKAFRFEALPAGAAAEQWGIVDVVFKLD